MFPMMITAGNKLVGQVIFIFAGILCLKLGEREMGIVLISSAVGSLVPVAEKAAKEIP